MVLYDAGLLAIFNCDLAPVDKFNTEKSSHFRRKRLFSMNANKPSTRGAKVNAEKTEVVQTSRRGRGAPGQAKIQQVNGGPRGRGGGAAATVPPVKDSKVDVAVSADASKQKNIAKTSSLQMPFNPKR
ncbi:hypothetical protein D918_04713 [Trichuris suis]|nr:hypothetical protein D918_04713 [Trichuris suis]